MEIAKWAGVPEEEAVRSLARADGARTWDLAL